MNGQGVDGGYSESVGYCEARTSSGINRHKLRVLRIIGRVKMYTTSSNKGHVTYHDANRWIYIILVDNIFKPNQQSGKSGMTRKSLSIKLSGIGIFKTLVSSHPPS
jgi:hypothetical protein